MAAGDVRVGEDASFEIDAADVADDRLELVATLDVDVGGRMTDTALPAGSENVPCPDVQLHAPLSTSASQPAHICIEGSADGLAS